jgi:hypothetical protein
VDVEDLHGLPGTAGPGTAAEGALPSPPAEAAAQGEDGESTEARLRAALRVEIATALASGRPGLTPLGKWLGEDLVLTAARLSAGVSRRAADLLGIPDTTFRRQFHAAAGRRTAGLAVRSPQWNAVATLLEPFIRARPAGADACERAESVLLAEIDTAAPGDSRIAAALLGVTPPTLFRRKEALTRRS